MQGSEERGARIVRCLNRSDVGSRLGKALGKSMRMSAASVLIGIFLPPSLPLPTALTALPLACSLVVSPPVPAAHHMQTSARGSICTNA